MVGCASLDYYLWLTKQLAISTNPAYYFCSIALVFVTIELWAGMVNCLIIPILLKIISIIRNIQ